MFRRHQETGKQNETGEIKKQTHLELFYPPHKTYIPVFINLSNIYVTSGLRNHIFVVVKLWLRDEKYCKQDLTVDPLLCSLQHQV